MTKNDHFETQKCHFWAFLASFKISFSSLQHPKHNGNPLYILNWSTYYEEATFSNLKFWQYKQDNGVLDSSNKIQSKKNNGFCIQ